MQPAPVIAMETRCEALAEYRVAMESTVYKTKPDEKVL